MADEPFSNDVPSGAGVIALQIFVPRVEVLTLDACSGSKGERPGEVACLFVRIGEVIFRFDAVLVVPNRAAGQVPLSRFLSELGVHGKKGFRRLIRVLGGLAAQMSIDDVERGCAASCNE